ncbi:ATP-binding protein [Faunimonas sp. B44]|uniref:ATP-binding protein n=1 Tax=Faunimonas sp. B44 TaxID=3461493 RepID=UPI0040441B58
MHWRDSALAFSGMPELSERLLSAVPTWLWSMEGQRVLWANPAGGAELGAAQFADLAGRRFPVNHPLRRDVESVARIAGEAGTLARLHLPGRAVPLLCRAWRVRTPVGDSALLIEALGAAARKEHGESALVRFFSGSGFEALLLEPGGEGGGDRQPAADPGGLDREAVTLRLGGRPVQLHIAESRLHELREAPAADGWPAAAAPTETLEDAPSGPGEPGPDVPEPAPAPVTPEPDSVPEPGPQPEIPDAPPPGPEVPHEPEPDVAPEPGPGPEIPNAPPAGPEIPGTPAGPEVPAPPGMEGADQWSARLRGREGLHPLAGRWEEPEPQRRLVRFLWQTDAADRFLFVSPGLAELVGRNAEVVGERWSEAADRLRLDPPMRIARALRQRDTWSGLTVWWPVEGSGVRVPAELTGLPVFGIDQSFQGYRGFGVLKPAEALMPAAFEARFGVEGPVAPAVQQPSYEEAAPSQPAKVVPIRADIDRLPEFARLSAHERSAFEEIAAALQARIEVPMRRRSDADGASRFAERVHGGDAGTAATGPGPERREGAQPGDHQAHGQEGEGGGTTGRVLHLFPVDTPLGDPGAEAPSMAGADEDGMRDTGAGTERPAAAPRTVDGRDAGPGGPASAEWDVIADVDLQPFSADEGGEPIAAPLAQAVPERAGDADQRIRELAAILDTATDGVVILDGFGLIESLNASAEALFGLASAEAAGRPFGDLLTEEGRAVAFDYLEHIAKGGVASLLNAGREVDARVGAATLPLFMTMGRLSDGEPGRFCAVLRDITPWKRAEADLVAARKKAEAASTQKSEFLARVSHEIRTPLNAIIGFAEVMIEERFGPIENEKYREYLRDIRRSSEHVVSLVNDLLDISKIEAGKLELSFEAVPINELLRDCIALMQPQANRSHVILRSSLSGEVPPVMADARTLRQIVLNLLSNSVKFTGPGGQVIASTSVTEEGEAVLRVRDTGEGMSEVELERAMEPFRQLTTATISRSGTGLGLPLTKALVEANRASFSIRSAPGEGTIVKIVFPATRVLAS